MKMNDKQMAELYGVEEYVISNLRRSGFNDDEIKEILIEAEW